MLACVNPALERWRPRIRIRMMTPYSTLAKHLENGIRWSNLWMAQSRLSLLQLRLLLKEGRRMERETAVAVRRLKKRRRKRR